MKMLVFCNSCLRRQIVTIRRGEIIVHWLQHIYLFILLQPQKCGNERCNNILDSVFWYPDEKRWRASDSSNIDGKYRVINNVSLVTAMKRIPLKSERRFMWRDFTVGRNEELE